MLLYVDAVDTNHRTDFQNFNRIENLVGIKKVMSKNVCMS